MEEVRAVLNAPTLATRSGIRDRAMMHRCFAGGLRVSELVGVRMENLSLRHGASLTVLGKGHKERCKTSEHGRDYLLVKLDDPRFLCGR
ncbi:tyrosine-type recombinase/integrase [Rhizobium grahamii]|uniref:tyrosine-type recombinase/integrase n=1 Tax=Rhizobium grahamii TaxID=1120045 RepID=UPI001FD11072|nr:tyrosine-type recombinase/integrase [Rhizobium grahamii]